MDPVEKRNLVKKRAFIKTRVTRLSTFINSFQEGSNLNDMRVRQSLLNTSKDEYNDIQTQLEIYDVEESHDVDRESFEDLCLDIQEFVDLNTFQLVESSIATLLHSNVVSSPKSVSSCSAREIKLPAISLPKFNGNIAEFMHSLDTFKALVISNEALTDVQRYYYLLSCVSGAPRKMVENLPVTESNFKIAWDLIVQRYNNPKLIVDLHVKELLNLPNVRVESAKDLRMLINQLMRNLNAIEVMQVGIPLHEILLSHILLDHIRVTLRKQWECKTADTTFPRLKDLVAFLEASCQTLELIHPDKMLPQSQQPAAMHTKAGEYSSRRTFLATSPDCAFCNSKHKLSRCPKFKESDSDSRIDFVNRQKLCFNCLGANHRHRNTLLHKEQASSSDSRNQETGVQQHQTYCTVKGDHQRAEVLLSTALVNIADNDGKLYKCRAFIDSASQITLCLGA
ncbi:uncharacterized protein LOC126183996 [Schistocerca cancellata]|uniref:uncharacterized protein LOC126183996 n=1 Tax=Schistocerca cancellata TaxID=274614 RepID=UPI002117DABD|nr:uncharacterized protein LOC126183996 [Schistocerca cancellata]